VRIWRSLSWPAWLILVGGVTALPGIAELWLASRNGALRIADLLRATGPPSILLILTVVGAVGAMTFGVGLIAYVIHGSSSAERAQRGYGSLGTILACFGTAIIVANLITL